MSRQKREHRPDASVEYERMEPERGQRRLYAVVRDGKDIGIVWKMSDEDSWTFERLSDGRQFSDKRRQDAVAAGIDYQGIQRRLRAAREAARDGANVRGV